MFPPPDWEILPGSIQIIKEMNIGLHKYVESLRLMKAMQMLKEDRNATMSRIAATLGYSNERQFFRIMLKTGICRLPNGLFHSILI